MHNRLGAHDESREIGIADAAAIIPFVAVILVLAFYPQFLLKRSEPTVSSQAPLVTTVASR
jgi:NADH:ubiquinone oxidoreductase subunit 4 (subunit M)